jgi:hypothetical protein
LGNGKTKGRNLANGRTKRVVLAVVWLQDGAP